MLSTIDQEPLISICGPTLIVMLCFFTICCYLIMMEGSDLKSLEFSLLVTGYQTVTPLAVLCMP